MLGFERRSNTGRFSRKRAAARETKRQGPTLWHTLRERGGLVSLGIAAGFCVCLIALFLLREQVVPFRPGQFVPHDITARVDFVFYDRDRFDGLVDMARKSAPHVYRQTPGDVWSSLEQDLLTLPDRVAGAQPQELEPPLRDILDGGALTQLDQSRTGPDRQRYDEDVKQFITWS